MPRALILVALCGLLAGACGGGSLRDSPGPENESAASTPTPEDVRGTVSSENTDTTGSGGGSALQILAGSHRGEPYPASLPQPLVDTADLLQAQVPDGIPAIDRPAFDNVHAADEWLADGEAVVALDLGGEARAYPVQVLVWHEIVNDVVGGVPVAVTYCPLCNSAVTYERTVRDKVTTFGTSGLLFNSALVMYDRETESLWTHFDGRAIAGTWTGEQLALVPSPLLSWLDFKAAFPDGLVLSRDRTGYDRPYGSNPYPGYDDPDGRPFLFRGAVDGRLDLQRRVTGVTVGQHAKAWSLEAISGGSARVTHDVIGDTDLVIFWKSGQATALEGPGISDGRDVGSVGVFVPELDGRDLHFRVDGSSFVDEETGSIWNVAGEAVGGSFTGRRLESINHFETFWFAWLSYNPGTLLVPE